MCARPHDDSITSEIEIGAPPERVFAALTDEGQLARWFTNSECPVKFWKFDARLGGKYAFESESANVAVNGVREFKCHGEIVEYDPPRLLAYTWVANWHDDKSLKTLVRYELSKKGSGTHLRVTHSGLNNEATALKDYAGGWPGVLVSLKAHVEK